MQNKPLKVKVASALFGVIGMFSLISAVVSLSSMSAHLGLFRIGVGLSFIHCALEPEMLFMPFSIKVVESPAERSPLCSALSVVSTSCLLLAGATWLVS